jgi:hypothetical protein
VCQAASPSRYWMPYTRLWRCSECNVERTASTVTANHRVTSASSFQVTKEEWPALQYVVQVNYLYVVCLKVFHITSSLKAQVEVDYADLYSLSDHCSNVQKQSGRS